jgi:hypothetical protein
MQKSQIFNPLKYNAYFAVDRLIGEVISEAEFLCLMAERRIFSTYALFGRMQASKAFGGDPLQYPDELMAYRGLVFTTKFRDFGEARFFANYRAGALGWVEFVEGVLVDLTVLAPMTAFTP